MRRVRFYVLHRSLYRPDQWVLYEEFFNDFGEYSSFDLRFFGSYAEALRRIARDD